MLNTNKSNKSDSQKSSSAFNFDSQIVEDWNGGYKLEIDLKAEFDVEGWEVDISLPYSIREVYGVDLIDRGKGNYTISGQNDQVNLKQGQSISPIFIVEDNGQLALVPEFISSDSKISTKTEDVQKNINVDSDLAENLKGTQKNINVDSDLAGNLKGNQKIINVDSDLAGNLKGAIAAANDGDVVKLGNNTYYTDGIVIDKDITIDGQKGSVINGNGTSKSIFHLTSGASGATIQDLEIKNGNNGIRAEGASNLTLQNLDIHNIGINQTIRDGSNNTGISLDHVDDIKLLNSKIYNIGKKAVGIIDTDGGMISGLSIQDVNLEAEHAQSHDAGGVKLFNTNDITVKDSYFSDINAISIWNDITNLTTIENNVIENVGEDFLAPSFNYHVDISGVYNEKSSNSIVRNNDITSVGEFLGFKATEFAVETITLENNDFERYELGTTDFWVNESAEKLVALTEDPDKAGFSLFAEDYISQANIGI